MRILSKWLVFGSFALFASANLAAQTPETPVNNAPDAVTEATDPDSLDRPLDDIVKKELIKDRRVLPYEPVREADLFFEKRIWRIIDVREKMNLPFTYPEDPFFQILTTAVQKSPVDGGINVYSTEDDKFSKRLSADEVAAMLFNIDTAVTFDPETYEEKIQIVRNEINWEDVKRYRIKEIWYFDKESSVLKVRILGIAPLIDVKDNDGNFRYEKPMFWVYYPECRGLFARHKAFSMGGNDAAPMSWEDVFEMRYFASYIYKESNVYDRKIEEYMTGVDKLVEGDKIRQEIFNFEHDLWSY